MSSISSMLAVVIHELSPPSESSPATGLASLSCIFGEEVSEEMVVFLSNAVEEKKIMYQITDQILASNESPHLGNTFGWT